MPYAAIITSAEHAPGVLEDIAPFFASGIATIWRRENQWILESSSFEPYEFDEKLYQAANRLVAQIHSVLALYLGRYGDPLTVRALLRLTDDDKLIALRRYSTLTVNVVMPAEQVFSPTASGSVGTVVLSRAVTDPAIAEALSLLGHEAPTWGKIYDIIEFLGGPRTIEKSGFAPERETRRVKQTANYYRHIGNPKEYKLPSNPPTLYDAGMFAFDLMKRWIAKQISEGE